MNALAPDRRWERFWPRRSPDLLLQAALAPWEQAKAAWAAWRQDYDLDEAGWPEVRLLAALAPRIDDLEPDGEIGGRVKGIRKFLWTQTQMCLQPATPALKHLGDCGIPMLLLKGAARVAVDPTVLAERLIRDVDVLVPPDEHARAFDALTAVGWTLDGWQIAERKKDPFSRHHAWSLRRGRSEIDIHHFSNTLNRLVGDDDGLWARAGSATLGGVAVFTPSPADALLVSLAHGVRWSQDGAADWAVDACALLDADLDWDVFVQEVRARRLEAIATAGLGYLARRLGRRVPAEVWAPLAPGCVEPFLAELDFYATSEWPRRPGEVQAAAACAMLRSRSGPVEASASARRLISRTASSLSAGQSNFGFRTPPEVLSGEPDDRGLSLRFEFLVEGATERHPLAFSLHAPGLPLAQTLPLCRPSGDDRCVAEFTIDLPANLLSRRRIPCLWISVLRPADAGQAQVRRAEIAWSLIESEQKDEPRSRSIVDSPGVRSRRNPLEMRQEGPPTWTPELARFAHEQYHAQLGRIEPAVSDAARSAIQGWMDRNLGETAPAGPGQDDLREYYRRVSYGDPGLRADAAVLAPFERLWPLAQALVGDDLLPLAEEPVQIAIRFPGERGYPHLDGFGAPESDTPVRVPSAVLGVYLTDVGVKDGAFLVWPQGVPLVAAWARSLERAPVGRDDAEGPLLDLKRSMVGSPARAVVGPAGTAFLCHGACLHANGLNAGPRPRMAIFVRLYRRSHQNATGGAWEFLKTPETAWVASAWTAAAVGQSDG